MFLGTHAILHAMNRTDRWGDATVEGLVMRSNTFTTAESIVLDGAFKTTNGVVIGAPSHIDMRLLRADLSC